MYEVAGKIMSGVRRAGYRLKKEDGSFEDVNNDVMAYLVGRGEVKDVSAEVCKRGLLYRGKNGFSFDDIVLVDTGSETVESVGETNEFTCETSQPVSEMNGFTSEASQPVSETNEFMHVQNDSSTDTSNTNEIPLENRRGILLEDAERWEPDSMCTMHTQDTSLDALIAQADDLYERWAEVSDEVSYEAEKCGNRHTKSTLLKRCAMEVHVRRDTLKGNAISSHISDEYDTENMQNVDWINPGYIADFTIGEVDIEAILTNSAMSISIQINIGYEHGRMVLKAMADMSEFGMPQRIGTMLIDPSNVKDDICKYINVIADCVADETMEHVEEILKAGIPSSKLSVDEMDVFSMDGEMYSWLEIDNEGFLRCR